MKHRSFLRQILRGAAISAVALAVLPNAGTTQQLDLSREVADVKRHIASPQLGSALDFVETQIADPSDVIQDWIGVCNALGPSGDEIFRSRHIYKMFRIYGLEQVYIDDKLNVIAVRPGTGNGPKVVLNAHHDNVAIWPKEQPMEAFERDGRVYCQAAGDDVAGVVQLFTVLRAMNEANLETEGDVWFVALSGEETGSEGAEYFARAHYPHNLDWRNGDAAVQLHGGAGVGVSTGSDPVIKWATLRIFMPFERNVEDEQGADRRWRPHAVDVLSRIIVRIRTELTDERTDCLRCSGTQEVDIDGAEWYINPSVIRGSPVVNRPTSEASVTMDIRAQTDEQMTMLHQQIRDIAAEVCEEIETVGFPPHHYTERCSYIFDVNVVMGRDWTIDPIEGWDRTNNPQARYVAAAANALYGFDPVIDESRGCGDCRNMYKMGLPAMSFRGDVVDYGNGRFERGFHVPERAGGHDVTESMAVLPIFAGVKHALVFAASYAGIPGVGGAD